MKKIVLLVAFCQLGVYLQAQTTHKCGSHLYWDEMTQSFPALKQHIESHTDHGDYKTRSTTVIIPVVFHVVYKSVAENLAVSYLNAQIDLLNQCYARENSDTVNMRSIYSSRVGKSKIRFYIDQVKRVSTTMTAFNASSTSGFANSDIVKQTGSGGSDAVSPSTKLNIWICDLKFDGTDGLVGYAYPPIGAPNWPAGSGAPSANFDGVVIDYLDVGGPAKQPLGYSSYGFRGKALVHEIGHYLGLRHIWGDDNGACPGQVGYKDDGIADTPVTDENSNFDCNKTKNSCTESSGDLPDMVENYMDYSAESCQNSFTIMQISAMEYVLDNIRSGVRLPLGIEESVDLSKQISIFPNPVSEILYVDMQDLTFKNVTIRLTNSIGQMLMTASQTNSHTPLEIDCSDFAKGLYFLQLVLDGQHTITQKVQIK